MKAARVVVVVVAVVTALGTVLGCSGKDAAIKECHAQCDKARVDGESACTGPGAETCRKVVSTNVAACTQSCAAAAANGRCKIRW